MVQLQKRLTLRDELRICEEEKARLEALTIRSERVPKRNIALFCFLTVFILFNDLYSTGMAMRQHNIENVKICKHNMEEISLAEEAYYSEHQTYSTNCKDLKKYLVEMFGTKRALAKMVCPITGKFYQISPITADIAEGYQISCGTYSHSWTFDTGVVLRDY